MAKLLVPLILTLSFAAKAASLSSSCPSGPVPMNEVQAANLKDLSRCVVTHLCDEKKAFIKESYASRKTLQEIVEGAAKSPSRVLILGESHAERNSSFIKMTFEKMKEASPPVDCILFETSKTKYQKVFDLCNEGKECPEADRPDFTGVEEALRQKLKIYAVDQVKDSVGLNFTPDADIKDFIGDVNRRNRVMTSGAEALLKSGKCHREILIIGAEHGRTDRRLTSIPQLMAKKKITNYRIEMASPGLNSFGHPDTRWTWMNTDGKSICREVPGPLGENFGFITSKAAKNIPSDYFPLKDPHSKHGEFTGSWGDYDAVVFLGCKDAAQTKCAVDRSEYHLDNPEYLAPPEAK